MRKHLKFVFSLAANALFFIPLTYAAEREQRFECGGDLGLTQFRLTHESTESTEKEINLGSSKVAFDGPFSDVFFIQSYNEHGDIVYYLRIARMVLIQERNLRHAIREFVKMQTPKSSCEAEFVDHDVYRLSSSGGILLGENEFTYTERKCGRIDLGLGSKGFKFHKFSIRKKLNFSVQARYLKDIGKIEALIQSNSGFIDLGERKFSFEVEDIVRVPEIERESLFFHPTYIHNSPEFKEIAILKVTTDSRPRLTGNACNLAEALADSGEFDLPNGYPGPLLTEIAYTMQPPALINRKPDRPLLYGKGIHK